jgi:hypothetical protein
LGGHIYKLRVGPSPLHRGVYSVIILGLIKTLTQDSNIPHSLNSILYRCWIETRQSTRRQPLGEDVDELQCGRDEVQVDLYVLRALMLHEIGGEVNRADVIAVDEGEALEELWSSWRSWRGQEASATLLTTARCSAFALERETTGYRLVARRQGWRPETRHNRKWTDACRDSQPNQCRCRPRAPMSGRVGVDGPSQGSHRGSEGSA